MRFRDLNGGAGSVALGLYFFLWLPVAIHGQSPAPSPVSKPIYKIIPVESKISFGVKASVSIEGIFEKWSAHLTFRSTDASTGVLDVKILADSVNTGSSLKNDELKSEKFFDAQNDPYITFHSSKFVQTGPHTFDLHGTFSIRGISKPETLTFLAEREEKGAGEIKGAMVFDRKQFGMDSGIPFLRIADRVEVTIDFKAIRIDGPALLFKP
jgi:polyisoprenoid-binding protein YceI